MDLLDELGADSDAEAGPELHDLQDSEPKALQGERMDGDGLPVRELDEFSLMEQHGHELWVPFEITKSRPGSDLCRRVRGKGIVTLRAGTDFGRLEERLAVLANVDFWEISNDDDGVPTLWIRTTSARYKLLTPHRSFKAAFVPALYAMKCVRAVSAAAQETPGAARGASTAAAIAALAAVDAPRASIEGAVGLIARHVARTMGVRVSTARKDLRAWLRGGNRPAVGARGIQLHPSPSEPLTNRRRSPSALPQSPHAPLQWHRRKRAGTPASARWPDVAGLAQRRIAASSSGSEGDDSAEQQRRLREKVVPSGAADGEEGTMGTSSPPSSGRTPFAASASVLISSNTAGVRNCILSQLPSLQGMRWSPPSSVAAATPGATPPLAPPGDTSDSGDELEARSRANGLCGTGAGGAAPGVYRGSRRIASLSCTLCYTTSHFDPQFSGDAGTRSGARGAEPIAAGRGCATLSFGILEQGDDTHRADCEEAGGRRETLPLRSRVSRAPDSMRRPRAGASAASAASVKLGGRAALLAFMFAPSSRTRLVPSAAPPLSRPSSLKASSEGVAGLTRATQALPASETSRPNAATASSRSAGLGAQPTAAGAPATAFGRAEAPLSPSPGVEGHRHLSTRRAGSAGGLGRSVTQGEASARKRPRPRAGASVAAAAAAAGGAEPKRSPSQWGPAANGRGTGRDPASRRREPPSSPPDLTSDGARADRGGRSAAVRRAEEAQPPPVASHACVPFQSQRSRPTPAITAPPLSLHARSSQRAGTATAAATATATVPGIGSHLDRGGAPAEARSPSSQRSRGPSASASASASRVGPSDGGSGGKGARPGSAGRHVSFNESQQPHGAPPRKKESFPALGRSVDATASAGGPRVPPGGGEASRAALQAEDEALRACESAFTPLLLADVSSNALALLPGPWLRVVESPFAGGPLVMRSGCSLPPLRAEVWLPPGCNASEVECRVSVRSAKTTVCAFRCLLSEARLPRPRRWDAAEAARVGPFNLHVLSAWRKARLRVPLDTAFGTDHVGVASVLLDLHWGSRAPDPLAHLEFQVPVLVGRSSP